MAECQSEVDEKVTLDQEYTLWWIVWNQPLLAILAILWVAVLVVSCYEVNGSVGDCNSEGKSSGLLLVRSDCSVDNPERDPGNGSSGHNYCT